MMKEKKCPNCGMKILYDSELSETGTVKCLCGFPLLLPVDEYVVIEMDENKETILSSISFFEEI